jgi:uncharacterized YigZ family protein
VTARYPIPATRHRSELVERRSRFVATADYTPSVDEARAFIDEMRREYPDATHHVYAFAVGFGSSVTHGMSDDGEPSGTAGRPTLAVVRGSGLGDVCVVTTRYFGGTKLGTGGLVRAYTAAAQLVLEGLPTMVREEKRTVVFSVPYARFEVVSRLVAAHGGEIADADFGTEVTIEAALAVDHLEAFAADLAEATSGQAKIVEATGP